MSRFHSAGPDRAAFQGSAAFAVPRNGSGRRGQRIGLMGGSFNPAHVAHRHVALLALKRLKLDEIWWLVAPQNPLKSASEMASISRRLAAARQVAANHPKIRVRDVESRLSTAYTVDTIETLVRRGNGTRFVWIMGADNLVQFRHWQRWSRIFHLVSIAVFDRPTYSLRALSSLAAQRFARFRLPVSSAAALADRVAPAWIYFHTRLDPTSATEIRRAEATARNKAQRKTILG
ncbi:MAG: nicotinate-nucleotide adenylyltransferase [Rhodospirillaceae bacterium]|nr:nicotinate-nucleotide adenylyltransferase [Rhodospirillaceae bacterium]